MSDDELPTWYHQRWQSRALQGQVSVALPPDEPSNICSIELARTQRAIRLMREAAFKGRPL
jgi:hypothetical protein